MKNTIFRLKILSPVFTLGHASGISFDNFVGIFSKIAWRFSISVRNWKRKKGNWKKIIPSRCSIGHVEGDFDNPSYETSTKGENLPARFEKLRWNRFFLRNSIFLENVPNGHSECSFGRHAENFSTITEKFSIKFCLFRKRSFFWEKIFFLGMLLWTRSYKISQPRRNFSGRDRTTLQQRPKVIN